MIQKHFPHSLKLPEQSQEREKDRCETLPICFSELLIVWHFARQVVVISLRLLKRLSSRLYLPSVLRELMKYPADIWMCPWCDKSAQYAAHTTGATTRTSNMLNDERLRVGGEAVAVITASPLTLFKYSNNSASGNTQGDMIFQRCLKDWKLFYCSKCLSIIVQGWKCAGFLSLLATKTRIRWCLRPQGTSLSFYKAHK